MLHAFDKLELIPRTKRQRNIPVPICLFLLSFANDHNDSILVQLDNQSWISRMHALRLTALALRCSIRVTATEMVAIAP